KLLDHACLRLRFAGGAPVLWEFERDGAALGVEPTGPLVATLGNAADVIVAAAITGNGIIYLFEDWLRPHLGSGELEPILERWWPNQPPACRSEGKAPVIAIPLAWLGRQALVAAEPVAAPSASASARVQRLVRDHLAAVWRTARDLGVAECDQDDVVQEVLIV